jgi:hypothetical protein
MVARASQEKTKAAIRKSKKDISLPNGGRYSNIFLFYLLFPVKYVT